MSELIIRSPGVFTREIDLSGPTPSIPVGVPAGIIGTANEGPAFVPLTFANFSEFSTRFGPTDGEKFGPLAVNEWLKNAQSVSYVRVLGAGNGKKRSTTGAVTNAGFVAGAKQVQSNGNVGINTYAVDMGSLGRTYFLACAMSESNGSTIFSSAGIQNSVTSSMILRGVVMAPSGVLLTLSGAVSGSSNPSAAGVAGASQIGSITGSVSMPGKEFAMILNGHTPTSDAPNVITASFDVLAGNYFPNIFNTDPYKVEEKGHLLYGSYDLHPAFAVVTGSGLFKEQGSEWDLTTYQDIAVLTTGSAARATASSTVPDFESFEDRFTTPRSSWVTSQDFGGQAHNLFRVFSLSDGDVSNNLYKISIENISKGRTSAIYGTFDLLVRRLTDDDTEMVVLERYRGLTLDPTSDRYVARVIGDQNTYFDFDNVASSQKIVVQGDHPIVSRYIRVEQSNALINGEVPVEALPFGFRGPSHLVTSGSGILALSDIEFASNQYNTGNGDWNGANVIQPPIPYRQTVSLATGENKRSSAQFYWGIQTSRATDVNEPNRPDLFDNTFFTLTKYFSNYQLGALNVSVGDNQGVADKASGAVLDSDRFDNNRFTLGRVRVRTGSDGLADPDYWMSASYVREGGIVADVSAKTRAFSVNDLSRFTNKKFAKFTFYMGGGFDGTNVFNKDQYELTNNSALREMTDSTNQGGTKGSTVASFRKATDVMGSTSDVDIKLLSIPGMRHSSISDYAISTVENRFDAMYIMDVEERDALNSIVTSSADQPSHVANTVASFKNRALDTSFAAAYFPDVVVQDPTTRTSVRVPPSVAVMGAFSLNDAIGHPWFAPAGFTRGSLSSVTSVATSLNRNNMDDLYDADINPLTSFPGTSVMVFGQKTLLAMPSSLDRVNVRRLLINVRRQIRNVANRLLFEPNRQETLDKFNALVNPIMQNVQEQSGVDRYKVVIDTTTTTQADVENNTLRGKIFLQPTRTAEFISLDFVVTNAGADI